MQAARERRLACIRPPPPAYLDPPGCRLWIGARFAAQHRGLPGERFVHLSLARSLEDPGDRGEEVGTAVSELPELGHRCGFLGVGELAPLRPVTRLAVNLSDEKAVRLRAFADHVFSIPGAVPGARDRGRAPGMADAPACT